MSGVHVLPSSNPYSRADTIPEKKKRLPSGPPPLVRNNIFGVGGNAYAEMVAGEEERLFLVTSYILG